MDILIIAPTKEEYERMVQTYPPRLQQQHRFHHITAKEQMLEYKMPVQIRFTGNWWDIEDAPSVEYYVEHVLKAPIEGAA